MNNSFDLFHHFSTFYDINLFLFVYFSFANRDSFISLFSNLYVFIPFSCLLHLLEHTGQYWIGVVRVEIFALYLILEEKYSLFYQWVGCGVFVDASFQVKEVPLYSKFSGSFYHKRQLNFVKWFCYINWYDNVVLFFFSLLECWITLIDFQIVNPPYILGMNPAW